MITTIKFAKSRDDAIIPTKRDEDAGFDVYPCFDEDYIVIRPHETKIIHTGIHSAFDKDYVVFFKERGSTGTKGIGQRAGVVDSGYRGEWMIPITNHNTVPLIIAKKEYDEHELNKDLTGEYNYTCKKIVYPYEKAIVQAVLLPIPEVELEEYTINELMSIPSERGEGCLGSSQK